RRRGAQARQPRRAGPARPRAPQSRPRAARRGGAARGPGSAPRRGLPSRALPSRAPPGDARPARGVLNPEAAPLDFVAGLAAPPPVVARARLASLLDDPLDLRRAARGLLTAV